MRKVTIVVPVLTTSCQVSDQWNRGPVIDQIRMTATARAKVCARPVCRDAHWAMPEMNLFKAMSFRSGCAACAGRPWRERRLRNSGSVRWRQERFLPILGASREEALFCRVDGEVYGATGEEGNKIGRAHV